MDIQDLMNAGSQIADSVERHIKDGTYSEMTKELSDIAAETARTAGAAVQNAAASAQRYSDDFYRKAQAINEQVKQKLSGQDQIPATFDKTVIRHFGSRGKKVGHIFLLIICVIVCLATIIPGAATGRIPLLILGIIFAIAAVGSLINVSISSKQVLLKDSISLYTRAIGDQTSIKISDLADACGREESDVQNDVRAMIKAKIIPQGQLNMDGSILFLTSQAYRDYTMEELEKSKKQARMEEMPEEPKQVIRDGERYIREIHAYNEQIPGQAFSEQLNTLEANAAKIFEQVKKDPSSASSLNRMMNYYLPTAIKMLGAYIELEKQKAAGTKSQEILDTQREIETAVGTMNTAFDNLLEDMIRSQTWDVRSDISVMKTMMTQDGLVGSSPKGK